MAERTSRMVCLGLCWLMLQGWSTASVAQGLTVKNLAAALQAAPLLPIQRDKPPGLIPGTPVFGVVGGVFRGVEVLRVGDLATCPVPSPRQWFRVRAAGVSFSAQGKTELEDLRGFLGAPVGAMADIENVDVTLHNVWSIYSPPPSVRENFASALKAAGCAATMGQSRAAMVIRSVTADVTLAVSGHRLTRRHAEAFLSRTDSAPDVAADGATFTITLVDRIVALNLGASP